MIHLSEYTTGLIRVKWDGVEERGGHMQYILFLIGCLLCNSVGRGSGEDESQEDVLMDEAPSNISQASTLQANREGKCWF
jgi:hypothetical protein